MNQFVAPQFIDVEDRIIGPITTRQFIMIVIGGVICFTSYKILDTSSFAVVSLVTVAAVVLFGFVKINGRYFAPFIKSVIEAIRRPKIRVWHKKLPPVAVTAKKEEPKEEKTGLNLRREVMKPKHLAELALLVDTGGRYKG